MRDFLDILVTDAKATISEGYYEKVVTMNFVHNSLRAAILQRRAPSVIAEIKAASPSRGVLREKVDLAEIARAMARGGVVGISVLTEPKHFCGTLANIATVRSSVGLPVLMKDIIVDSAQIDAASKIGANAVLLIQAVFDRGYSGCSLLEMVAKAHSKHLEVLLETHNMDEFVRATKTAADLIGINNRNLGTLVVDLNVTKNILANCQTKGKLVVSESGISSTDDVRFLRGCGAQAMLIGSSIMSTDDIELKVREFVNA